jgi:hypothetical protein
MLLIVLVMQLGFGAVDSSGYVAKPKGMMSPSSTVISVNETAVLELTVQVEKAVYSLGESVNIAFTLTNISNQTINFPMAGWTFDFQILNDTNHLIFWYSTSQIFPQVIWNMPINSGENLTDLLVWPQMCNTTAWTAGVAVSPGTYYIVGLLWDISSLTLKTPPLQITVNAASIADPPSGGAGGSGAGGHYELALRS